MVKLKKHFKKFLVDYQLQIEISKFEGNGDLTTDIHTNVGQHLPSISEVFEKQLQFFIIQPFAEKLQIFLSEIFNELNFDG
jgi:hypothetical protein